MYRKREREFQYPPGIEKIIEDVIGGGTIDRRDLQNALFNGKALDELPPIVIVVKDPETGLYHVLKTAMASDAGSETTYKVAKNHLFGVGDFVTIGGALTGASDKITRVMRISIRLCWQQRSGLQQKVKYWFRLKTSRLRKPPSYLMMANWSSR